MAARRLLGATLVRDDAGGRRAGRIVELEAYIGEDDQASHARFGRTARNAVMYGEPGTAYVYLVYGMHHCLNVVTEPAGRPAALLIRAVEPLDGIEAMRAARVDAAGRASRRPTARADALARLARTPADRLAAGPALVAAAFGLDRSLTGRDILDPTSDVRLQPAAPGTAPVDVVATTRVGVACAGAWAERPWRFLDPQSASVSGRAGRDGAARPGPDERPR